MRLVKDEVIWLHGSYQFSDRALMHEAMVAAQRLIDAGAGVQLSLTCSVIDDNELAIIVKIPMFEEHDFVTSLFLLLARYAKQRLLEARVDVL